MASEQTTYAVNPQGVMVIHVGKRDQHTLELAKEDLIAVRRALNGQRAPLLIDLTQARSLDLDAREYYAQESPSVATCVGLITPSMVSKILGNFFIAATTFFSTKHDSLPLRLFDDHASALVWLTSVHASEGQRRSA